MVFVCIFHSRHFISHFTACELNSGCFESTNFGPAIQALPWTLTLATDPAAVVRHLNDPLYFPIPTTCICSMNVSAFEIHSKKWYTKGCSSHIICFLRLFISYRETMFILVLTNYTLNWFYVFFSGVTKPPHGLLFLCNAFNPVPVLFVL